MPDYLTNQINHNKWRFRNPDNWRIDFTVNGLYPAFDAGVPSAAQTAYFRRLLEGDIEVTFRIGFLPGADQTSKVEVDLVEDTGGGGDDGTSIGVITYEFTGGQNQFSTSWGTTINDSTSSLYDVKVVRSGSSINIYHKKDGLGEWVLEPSTVHSLENINFRIHYTALNDTYFAAFVWKEGCADEFCLELDDIYYWDGCCKIPMTFDDASTPDTIAPSSSITLYVEGGCPPYTWSVAGLGYTLDFVSTVIGQNGLNCGGGTCGVNYDPFATITVTDACGTSIEIIIRNTGGQWNVIGNVYNGNNNCASSFLCPTSKTVFLVRGNQLWSLTTVAAAFLGECTCSVNEANWNAGWLDGAGATFPPITPFTFWNTYFRVDPPICATCTGTEGSPSLVRGNYYEWGC